MHAEREVDMATAEGAGPGIVTLAPVLDLAAAQALKDALGEAIGSGADVVVDGADVERVNTPAVQILLAAALSCAAERRGFALRSSSDALRSAFGDLGLAVELNQWSSR